MCWQDGNGLLCRNAPKALPSPRNIWTHDSEDSNSIDHRFFYSLLQVALDAEFVALSAPETTFEAGLEVQLRRSR